ncbi:HAD family hydrolase [Lachnospiraceae bacterium 54-53]
MRNYPHVLESAPEFHMPWYLGVVNYHLGVQVSLENAAGQLHETSGEASHNHWELIDGARETLECIRSMGCRTGLISNWDSTCRSVLKESCLEPVLDTVIFSSEVGSGKPERKIFEIAFRTAGVRPEQCLHVGDNYYDDIKGAQGVGMDCLLVDPHCRTGPEDMKEIPVISTVKEVLKYLE